MSDPIPDSEYLARESIKQVFTPEIQKFVDGLDDPDNCWCVVLQYSATHYRLVIKVQPPGDKSFDLVFTTVKYFDGPTRWKGARFTVGSYEEGMELLGLVGNHWGTPAEMFQKASLHMGCLYKVSRGDTLVTRILAWSVGIGDVPRLE